VDAARSETPGHRLEHLLAEAAWMRALAEHLVRDASAEDIVQDTWLAALKCAPSGRLPDDASRARPWLAHVLANFASAKRRGDARRTERELRAARSEAVPSAAESAERVEAQRALVDALASLDEPYRTTVILRYFDGLSGAEIARRLAVPEGTVRWRLKHAVDELRARLDRRYGGERSAWSLALVSLARRSSPTATSSGLTAVGGVLTMHVLARIGIAAGVAALVAFGAWRVRDVVGSSASVQPSHEGTSASLLRELDGRRTSSGELAGSVDASFRARVEASAPVAIAPVRTDSATLEARFVDPAHRPLADVTLALVSSRSGDTVASVSSGVDGRVARSIELDDDTRTVRYQASCAGRATRFGYVTWEKTGATRLGDLVLETGGSVSGIVLGPDHGPIAGARVLVTQSELVHDLEISRRCGPGTSSGEPSARTRSDGTFQIDGVPIGVMRVWAVADGMRYSVTPPVEVHAHEVRTDISLELEAWSSDERIAGIVRDPGGAPVGGAEIECRYEGPRMSGTRYVYARSDGRFELRLEQKVPYDLHARDPKDRWTEIEALQVAPGTFDLELRFTAPRTVPLAVRAASGEPITRFAVRVKRADEMRLAEGVEEEHRDGVAAIRVPAQRFSLEARAPGYALGRLGPLDPVEVTGSLVCTLSPLPGIRGRVVAAGRPIAGAKLELVRMCDTNGRLEVAGFVRRLNAVLESTTSDADGSFRLTGRDGGRLAILCDADGFATSEVSPLDAQPAQGVDDLRIEMTIGGAIEGRVLVPDGVDPSGTWIELSRADGRTHEVRTGPDGAFRFDHLTPGHWDVRPTPAGTRRPSASVYSMDAKQAEIPWKCVVVDGETTRYDFDLRVSEHCVLAARVTVDGKPATGWMIAVWPDPHPRTAFAPPTKTIGEDGSARVEVEKPGRYTLAIGAPDEWRPIVQLDDRVVLVDGDNAWQLDLQTGRLEGHIGPESSANHFAYKWHGAGDLALRALVMPDAQGEFRFPRIPAGRGSIESYAYDAAHEVHWTHVLDVDVPLADVRRIELP
jgi:RNA polymerase sigma-70 factor (ECF subfamily)